MIANNCIGSLTIVAVLAVGAGATRVDDEVDALIAALQNDNVQSRTEAIQALRDLGPAAEKSIPALVAVLNDWRSTRKFFLVQGMRGPHVYDLAADALVAIGPKSIPPLVQAMKDEDRSVREHAATALSRFGGAAKNAVAPLCEALKDDDQWVRCSVARALGKIGSEEAIPSVIERLQHDESEWVRCDSAEALIGVDPTGRLALVALIAAVEDASPNVTFLGGIDLGAVRPSGQAGDCGADSRVERPVIPVGLLL